MKTATPELIALLADSKQFVMWETYTITLSNGNVVQYSTRDADAPMLPTVPEYNTSYLLDTFTGTGNLSTHIGEAGSNWAAVNYPPPLEDYLISGGALHLPQAGQDNIFLTQWAPNNTTLQDFFMEANLSCNVNGASVNIGVQSANTSAYMYAYADNNGSANVVYAKLRMDADGGLYDSGYVEMPVLANVPFTMRFEATANRTHGELFINSVSEANGTISSNHTLGSIGVSYMHLTCSYGSEGATLYSIAGDRIAPPPFFLDTFTGTGNLTTHVGETANPFVVYYIGTSIGTANMVLTGSGGVYNNTFVGEGQVLRSQYACIPSGTSDFYALADVSMRHNTEAYAYQMGVFLGNDADSTEVSLTLQKNGLGDGTPVTGSASLFDGSSYGNTFDAGLVNSGQVKRLLIEVTNLRKTFTYFLDGVQVGTTTRASSQTFDFIGLYVFSNADTNTIAHRVEGGPL